MVKIKLLVVAVLPLLPAAANAAGGVSPFDVRTLDGRQRTGVVRTWSLAGELVIERSGAAAPAGRADGPRGERIATADVDVLSNPRATPAPEPVWRVVTVDGQVLIGAPTGGDAHTLHVRCGDLATLKLPLDLVWRIDRGAGRRAAARGPAAVDRVVLANGDVSEGLITAAAADGLTVRVDDAELPLRWDVIRRVDFANEPAAPPPGLSVLFRLIDGSRLRARQLSWREASVEIEVLDGQRLQFAPGFVRSAEVVGGRRLWLSELPAARFDARPLFGPAWTPGLDANVLGGPLRVGGVEYTRGLGLHAPARLEWRLDGRFARFSAACGIDDSAGPWADAAVRFLVDQREAGNLPGLKHGRPPRPVSIDLRGAEVFVIEVDAGEHADVQDRVDLLDAALIRAEPPRD